MLLGTGDRHAQGLSFLRAHPRCTESLEVHHEPTPLTPEEVVVEIPDGWRNGQESGDSGDSTAGAIMAGVWMGV